MLCPSVGEGVRFAKTPNPGRGVMSRRCSGLACTPTKPAETRTDTVVVVNAHSDPSQPVQGVRVSLIFVAGSEKVTDARDATNRAGQALLIVSPEAAQRGDLRIEITGVSDLVVYESADGQLNELPSTVTIRLLPKGSVLLLGPAQIEAMLHRLSLQVKHLEQENREIKGELAKEQGQKPDDLTAAMTEWAKTNGFEPADADKKIQQWAEEIQKRKEEATADQKALAELALKHYGVAAQLFNKAADDIGLSMDEDEKKFLEDRRNKLRELVDKTYQSSNAYQLNLQYHQATQILERARDRAASEHGRYPEDAALRSIWLESLGRAAEARVAEGEVAPAGDSSALLSSSIENFRSLLHEYAAQEERRNWAGTQSDLGLALMDRGERISGAQSMESLAQAVKAYRAALDVYTKADLPQDWARTQNNLGIALRVQGERSGAAEIKELLAEAVEACRAALEVFTKADLPQYWAKTQNNLGSALRDQGERSSGSQATELLAQAVEAYRAALEVYTKPDFPRDWAMTQHNLGAALLDQGERKSGASATELLAQAVEAYRAALEVRTRQDLPQDWALAQNNLGNALLDQGERNTGSQATELLAEAVEAYRATLEVYTKADLPQDWAMTQNNLGSALMDQGQRSSGAQATELLAQAVEAYRATLDVYTKVGLPKDWARTQNNLGIALRLQGEWSRGAQATDLFTQAVRAFRAALEVRTKADLPQDWALTQNNLGIALTHEGMNSSGAQATELLAEAVLAYRAALEVRTKTGSPRDWADTQNHLGFALMRQGEVRSGAQAMDLLDDAASAFESVLEVFPTSKDTILALSHIDHDELFRFEGALQLDEVLVKIDPSTPARLNFEEANLTVSNFSECIEQAAAISDHGLSISNSLVRDTIKLACQAAAGQKAAAQETEKALLPRSDQLQKEDWGFAGTLHFLASSPAFETDRASWITLFESLDKGDGAAMAAALHQLEEVMKQ